MHKWRINFYMKNGTVLKGLWIGHEDNSNAVADKILNGNENTFNGVLGADGKSNLLIRMGELAAIDISVYKEEA